MNTKEFLNVLYRNVEDGYIGIPYIENGNVITKWFRSSEIDSIMKNVFVICWKMNMRKSQKL